MPEGVEHMAPKWVASSGSNNLGDWIAKVVVMCN